MAMNQATKAETGEQWWSSHGELYEVGSMLATVFAWGSDDVLRFMEKPWKWSDEREQWISLGRPDPETLDADQIEIS